MMATISFISRPLPVHHPGAQSRTMPHCNNTALGPFSRRLPKKQAGGCFCRGSSVISRRIGEQE
jgi:hypothetical protein